MPNFNQFYQHSQVPQQPGGYELASQGGIGFWSLVSPLGVVTNLNSLGIKVLGFTGAGMPPVENITTPYGLLGGSLLQRTVARPKTITLICAVQQENYAYVQRVLQSIINQTAPSNSLQTAQDLKLRFQLLNYQGKAAGTVLDTPVVYQGGLEGSVSGLYEERFILAFLDLNPPDTVETATLQPSLTLFNTAASHLGYEWRSSTTGAWNIVNVGNGPVNALMYDQSGDLWFGNSNTSAKVGTRSGSVSQAVSYVATPANSVVSALAQTADGAVYVGGKFTSPFNYFMKYLSGVFTAGYVGVNNTIQHMAAGRDGLVYLVGLFTTPGAGTGFAAYDPISTNMTNPASTGPTGGGAALNTVQAASNGDIYIGGGFTAFNGVSANSIIRYRPLAGLTYNALGSGVSGGGAQVYDIQNLPDGRLLVVGDFTSAGGISANNAAIWNGTSWSALGPGLNNLVNNAVVDQQNGDIYLFGAFTQLANNAYPITSYAVKYVNGTYQPLDITASPNIIWRTALRSTDKELATAVSGTVTVTYAGSFPLNYGGTADAIPQIKITGPGQFLNIKNFTTGKVITFNNLLLQPGEVATLTMTGAISFNSTFPQAGTNILGKILQGSDITLFSLVPGANYLDVLVTGTTGATKVELIYKNTHWGINAGA